MFSINHGLAHAAIAYLYFASCLGVDKTLIGLAIAVCYTLLSCDCRE